MNYDNRNYLVFDVSEIDKVNFNEILETSAETLRRSVDGRKTFVKWDSDTNPSFIDDLTTKEGPYTHGEIIAMLAGVEWSAPMNQGIDQ